MPIGPTGPLIAAGVGAAAEIGGQMYANAQNVKIAREQMRFQERMSNSAYQRATADMKAAGLNPMMMYHSGGPASTPSGSTTRIDSPTRGTSAITSGAVQQRIAQQQLANDTRRTDAEVKRADAAANLDNARAVTEAQHPALLGAQTAESAARLPLIGAQTDEARQRVGLIGAETLLTNYKAASEKWGLEHDKAMGLIWQRVASSIASLFEKADKIDTGQLPKDSINWILDGITGQSDTPGAAVQNFKKWLTTEPQILTDLKRLYDAYKTWRTSGDNSAKGTTAPNLSDKNLR